MLSKLLSLFTIISLCSSSISFAAHEADPSDQVSEQDQKYFAEICEWLTPHKKKFHTVRKYNADKIEQERLDFDKQKEQTAQRNRELRTPEVEIQKKVENLEWQFQQQKNYRLLGQQDNENNVVKSILEWCAKKRPEFYHTLMHMDPTLTRALALDKPHEEVLRGEYDEQAPRVAGR
jgi:hypothetical protein